MLVLSFLNKDNPWKDECNTSFSTMRLRLLDENQGEKNQEIKREETGEAVPRDVGSSRASGLQPLVSIRDEGYQLLL